MAAKVSSQSDVTNGRRVVSGCQQSFIDTEAAGIILLNKLFKSRNNLPLTECIVTTISRILYVFYYIYHKLKIKVRNSDQYKKDKRCCLIL